MITKKVCLLGSFAVGKTSLVGRFVRGIFSDRYLTTVGVKIDRKAVEVTGTPVQLMIWDLAGEDPHTRVPERMFRGMSGYLLVVDGTRAETIDVAMALRLRVEQAIGPRPFVVLYNKRDLDDDWEIAEPESLESRAVLDAGSAACSETSALTGVGVEAAFAALAAAMVSP